MDMGPDPDPVLPRDPTATVKDPVIDFGTRLEWRTTAGESPATRASQLETWFESLQDLDCTAFERAMLGLAQQKNQQFIGPLLNLLARSPAGCALSIAQAIATIGGRQACPGLLELLTQQTTAEVRLAVVYGLTWLLDFRGFQSLVEIYRCEHEPAEVRAQAAEGIMYLAAQGRPGSPRWRAAVTALLAGLDDPNAQVLAGTVLALGTLRARSALPKLRLLALADSMPGSEQQVIQAEARDAIESIERG